MSTGVTITNWIKKEITDLHQKRKGLGSGIIKYQVTKQELGAGWMRMWKCDRRL